MTAAAKLKLLAAVHVAAAAAGLLFGGGAILSMATSNVYEPLDIVVPVFVVLSAVWLLPGFFLGLALAWRFGWARDAMLVHAFLLLLVLPFGTALGVLSLVVLTAPDVRDMRDPSPREGRAYVFALCAIAALGALALIIGAGFIFRRPLEAAGDMAAPAAAIGILSIATLVFAVSRGGAGFSFAPAVALRRAQARASTARLQAEREARLAALRGDPLRAPFADMIAAGDHWSEEQIAYAVDPSARACCGHLTPIEGDMRLAGVLMRPMQSPRHAEARCVVDKTRLGGLPPSVGFDDAIQMGGRSCEDPPRAAFLCSACNSGIWTTPREEAKPDTPAWPPT